MFAWCNAVFGVGDEVRVKLEAGAVRCSAEVQAGALDVARTRGLALALALAGFGSRWLAQAGWQAEAATVALARPTL